MTTNFVLLSALIISISANYCLAESDEQGNYLIEIILTDSIKIKLAYNSVTL